jgi:hypothetical protein
MKKRILHLTLLRCWFDAIAQGRKKEEYREAKPYWDKRLDGKIYDEVWFRNGYARNAPFMKVECLGIMSRPVKPRGSIWVIKLGCVLELRSHN